MVGGSSIFNGTSSFGAIVDTVGVKTVQGNGVKTVSSTFSFLTVVAISLRHRGIYCLNYSLFKYTSRISDIKKINLKSQKYVFGDTIWALPQVYQSPNKY